jgi:hypothetical protein
MEHNGDVSPEKRAYADVTNRESARRSVRVSTKSGAGGSIGLVTQQLQSHDWGRKTVRIVKLVLKVVMQNDGDFVDLI